MSEVFTCPSCGAENPEIIVRIDAWDTRTVTMDAHGTFVEIGRSVETLDHREYEFACCGSGVFDKKLRDLVDREVR